MVNLRENREALLFAYNMGDINDEEFIMLYDLNRSTNLDLPYWDYERFDLDRMTDDECIAEFRLKKGNVYTLFETLNFPDEVNCCNRFKVDGIFGLFVLLKRFSYPCRYLDMMPRFGLSVPQMCMVTNESLTFLYDTWGHLLRTFQQNWLSPANLQRFSNAVHAKGSPLINCWGFIDGTVRRISRPGTNQRVLYNGHKKVHGIKFQSVAAPNGMVANLYGPVEGKRHDSTMLARSGLLNDMQIHSRAPDSA